MCDIVGAMKEHNNRKKIICVVGATASGKTGLGVELAKKFNGEIISADSRQVYRGLDIGTGKEGQPAQSAGNLKLNESCKLKIENLKRQCRFIEGIPQWLIDICVPEQDFSMFDWLELAKVVLDDIWSRGKTPIVVGGTGLYVQALIEGFSINQSSKIKDQNGNLKLKQYSREELNSFDLEKLQHIVGQVTTTDSRLDINNSRRLVRFIERIQASEEPVKIKPDFDFILIGRDLPRKELYAKIDKRVEEWFSKGFFEEVEDLLNSGVSLEWLDKIGLEYRILANFIKNKDHFFCCEESEKRLKHDKKEFEAMKQEMKWKIHQYARRQLIWWRRFEVEWVNEATVAEEIIHDFLAVDK